MQLSERLSINKLSMLHCCNFKVIKGFNTAGSLRLFFSGVALQALFALGIKAGFGGFGLSWANIDQSNFT